MFQIFNKIKKILKRKNFFNNKRYKFRRKIKYLGLNIIFYGTNNKISIGKNCKFKNSKIEIWGDNITVEIGNNCSFYSFDAIFSGSIEGNLIKIGDNFFNTDKLQMYAGGGLNNDITIGNDCLFSREIVIYTHDGHDIYENGTKNVINNPIRSIKIGDKVWLGHGVTILKNSVLPNNTVVGAQSVISKEFMEENTVIAGNNPKVVRHNISWKK